MSWKGIASGRGASGAAHSSLHAERNCRKVLPLSERVITVSSLPAPSILRRIFGLSAYSSDTSQIEPVHTPCAPSASEAATCRPVTTPPAASTGMSPAASTTCGTSEKVPMGPVCAPESCPCATSRSAPAAIARRACLGLPHSATMRLPWRLHCSTKSGGAPMPQATSSTSLSSTARICSRAISLERRKRVRMPLRFGGGTWYFSYRASTNLRCFSGSSRSITEASLSSGIPGGSTRFTPIGTLPARRRRSASSARISSGVRRVAPYTPRPPQRDTSAATGTECENANRGWRRPNRSHTGVRRRSVAGLAGSLTGISFDVPARTGDWHGAPGRRGAG